MIGMDTGQGLEARGSGHDAVGARGKVGRGFHYYT